MKLHEYSLSYIVHMLNQTRFVHIYLPKAFRKNVVEWSYVNTDILHINGFPQSLDARFFKSWNKSGTVPSESYQIHDSRWTHQSTTKPMKLRNWFQHSSGGNEENHEQPQSECPVTAARFEPRISQIYVNSVTSRRHVEPSSWCVHVT
jgi:hypothetical protein